MIIMIKKLEEWRGGFLLFLCFVLMINMYIDRINELNQIEDTNRIVYYENN